MECRTGLSLGISGDLSVCARHDYGMDDKVGRALTGSLADVVTGAEPAVSARPVPEDAAAVVPVMLALRERWRGRQAADRYLAHVAEGPAATLAALAGAGERSCRLWALGALTERGLHTADALAARAMRDPDPGIALWCAPHLAAPSGDLPGGAGPRLRPSAPAAVRAFTAQHVPDAPLTPHALRRLF